MTRILHLSDTHVSATGTDMDGVNAIAALERGTLAPVLMVLRRG